VRVALFRIVLTLHNNCISK